MSNFAPLSEGVLLNLYWDSVVLLQAGPVERYYTCNGTHTIERKEKRGVLVWHILPSTSPYA